MKGGWDDLQSSNAICTPPRLNCVAMTSGVMCGTTPLDVIAKKLGVSSSFLSGMMSFPRRGPMALVSIWLKISKMRDLPFSFAAFGNAMVEVVLLACWM